MNLLEQYIVKVIKETKRKSQYGTDYIEVEMIVDCYGNTQQTTHIFLPDEWEKAKAKGYYMA
jgi:hypothetical protein